MTNCDTLITVEVSLQITDSLYIYLQSGELNEHLKLCGWSGFLSDPYKLL